MKYDFWDHCRLMNWLLIIIPAIAGVGFTVGSVTFHTQAIIPLLMFAYEYFRIRRLLRTLPCYLDTKKIKEYIRHDYSRAWASAKGLREGLIDEYELQVEQNGAANSLHASRSTLG